MFSIVLQMTTPKTKEVALKNRAYDAYEKETNFIRHYHLFMDLLSCRSRVCFFTAYHRIKRLFCGKKAFVIALLTINTIVLAVLWFGSIKDFVFSVSYAVLRKKLNDKYADIKESSDRSAKRAPRTFALLYVQRF